jgi:hypothetical protein
MNASSRRSLLPLPPVASSGSSSPASSCVPIWPVPEWSSPRFARVLWTVTSTPVAGTAGGMTGGPPQFLRISAARCAREALSGFDAGKPLVFPGRAYRVAMRADGGDQARYRGAGGIGRPARRASTTAIASGRRYSSP